MKECEKCQLKYPITKDHDCIEALKAMLAKMEIKSNYEDLYIIPHGEHIAKKVFEV